MYDERASRFQGDKATNTRKKELYKTLSRFDSRKQRNVIIQLTLFLYIGKKVRTWNRLGQARDRENRKKTNGIESRPRGVNIDSFFSGLFYFGTNLMAF